MSHPLGVEVDVSLAPSTLQDEGVESRRFTTVLINALAVEEVSRKSTTSADLHLAPSRASDRRRLRSPALNCFEIESESLPDFPHTQAPFGNGRERYRIIAVPDPGLMKAQRWITQEVLSKADPHSASGFSKGDTS